MNARISEVGEVRGMLQQDEQVFKWPNGLGVMIQYP